METALIAGLGPVFVFCMLLLVIFLCKSQGYESGQKRAGRQGENYVCDLICQVLKEKDLLFSNVPIEIEGKRTELDHIIVNNRGIFIIEVKIIICKKWFFRIRTFEATTEGCVLRFCKSVSNINS